MGTRFLHLKLGRYYTLKSTNEQFEQALEDPLRILRILMYGHGQGRILRKWAASKRARMAAGAALLVPGLWRLGGCNVRILVFV